MATMRFIRGLLGVFIIWTASFAGPADAQDNFNWRENFVPSMPTLMLKYEVTYRLFSLNLIHLADAVVYATDGEWMNQSTGAWQRAFLLLFYLDTLEDPEEIGTCRLSIHNRLSSVLLKPTLEPIIFSKKDFLHIDTVFSKIDVHNEESFSVESGQFNYYKKDFLADSVSTNMPQFSRLVGQRGEVMRFMKMISSVYAADGKAHAATNDFTLLVYTENALVPIKVAITPNLRKVNVLDTTFNAICFNAIPSRECGGKGRPLSAAVASFRYAARTLNDPELIWLAQNTFDLGMIPLLAEYGLQIGSMRCSLVEMRLMTNFDNIQ